MKKIIAVFDGLSYSQSTEAYAIQFANDGNTHLVGLFLDDFTYHSYYLHEHEYAALLKEKIAGDEKDQHTRKAAAEKFQSACQKAGIEHTVHHDRSIASQELLHESIYADLIVLDKKESFQHTNKQFPADFIQDMLANAECPVLIVPSEFRAIEKIILLYDGGPSSVYAIKTFSYLFPGFNRFPTEVICVRNEMLNLHLPDNFLMKEFMKRHFPEAVYKVLKGNAENEIVKYLKNRKQHELLVMGAYERSRLSRWFKASMADKLMLQLKTPLFVTHR